MPEEERASGIAVGPTRFEALSPRRNARTNAHLRPGTHWVRLAFASLDRSIGAACVRNLRASTGAASSLVTKQCPRSHTGTPRTVHPV